MTDKKKPTVQECIEFLDELERMILIGDVTISDLIVLIENNLANLTEIRGILERLEPVVDKEIQSLVNALNRGGAETDASCSGHGRRPGTIALRDGRWLVIIEDQKEFEQLNEALNVVGCLPINAPLPKSKFMEEWKTQELLDLLDETIQLEEQTEYWGDEEDYRQSQIRVFNFNEIKGILEKNYIHEQNIINYGTGEPQPDESVSGDANDELVEKLDKLIRYYRAYKEGLDYIESKELSEFRDKIRTLLQSRQPEKLRITRGD